MLNNTTRKTRRILAVALAAIAVVAIVPGAASAKKKVIHADVGVWMQYQPPGNGVAKGFFFGGVSTDRNACKNTTIYIGREKNYDPNTWDYGWGFENVTAAGGGGFTRYIENADRGYQYTAWTGKHTVNKPHKKIICDYGTMNDVVNAS